MCDEKKGEKQIFSWDEPQMMGARDLHVMHLSAGACGARLRSTPAAVWSILGGTGRRRAAVFAAVSPAVSAAVFLVGVGVGAR